MEEDAKAMSDLGIIWVRINEFAWSQLEPRLGELNSQWLDEIIGILGNQKLKVVLATATATPPRWMIEKHPNMHICNKYVNARKHGSRRHYCFSRIGYAKECNRIVGMLAKRYGNNKTAAAWQIDNEYGCHDTTISYSKFANIEFQN